MTRIEELDVDGFKGLTDTHLEFGSLNVITGRNNTGKTSLLEAIEVGLAPELLERYENQVDNLINVYVDECHIGLSLSDQQCSLSIEFAPTEEALETTIDILVKAFSSGIKADEPDNQDLSNIIERVLRTELTDAGLEDIPDIGRNVLKVSYDGKSFWLSNFDKQLSQLIASKENQIKTSLKSELDFDPQQDKSVFEGGFEYVWFYVPIATNKSFAEYHPEPPEGPNDILFVEQPKIDGLPDADDEDAAIKKVEIRDYLNDHDITPEPGVTVEDFDFDVLVFEEDGERYQVPYDFMGDGFKTIVGILWQFVGEDDVSDVVLMEEPENHMHPGYVGELVPFLVNVAREEGVQLFISTHNVDFISEFFGEFSEDQQEFLESEFRLIQMTETVPKTFDYADAREQVEDLHLDLRGI